MWLSPTQKQQEAQQHIVHYLQAEVHRAVGKNDYTLQSTSMQ